ncbi:acyltransferase [Curtobacterium sp. 'Ferrero']|uniref:acyltransferase family protein n=1 Tax=Curtobacterium sp. 'Ferrero' TaxID=2033654 RepID=UPI000BCDD9A1|nr:acyltransferase family protein [Curtobacterium sp. 'Ferrero']PCN47252.1 acyltransferase [Curtobacterium sp. 'Ferrero']
MTDARFDYSALVPNRPQPHLRSDIQGLRALAIGLVVLYHLWPNRLPGGFVGVDVFFVISGFLITGHLVKAMGAQPSPRLLVDFYARRIRRLAPAAVLVILFVLVASALLLPPTSLAPTGWSALASTLFSQNWYLASQSVSYLETASQPSALQHFWSLSVEEQFYIVWPLLLIGAALVAQWRRRPVRPVVVTTIIALGALSLAWSLIHTAIDPDVAFFDTTSRAWQFAVGGAIALLPGRFRVPSLLAWVGVACIALATFLFSDSTAFPGTAALLPTFGAGLVIAARSPEDETWSWAFASRFGPVRWLGDVSYSAYLWHWPMIVLLPVALGHALDTRAKAAIIVATLILAGLSQRFVEQPLRNITWLTARRRRSFLAGATAAVVLAVGSIGSVGVSAAATANENAALIAKVTNGDSCYAAAAVGNPDCSNPFGRLDRAHLPESLADKPLAWQDDCIDDITQNTEKLCQLGDPAGTETVLLWGDSHAGAWSSAFDIAGKINHWRVIVAARNKCPSSLVAPDATAWGEKLPDDQQGWCASRNAWVLKTVVPRADRVVLANLWANYVFDDGRGDQAVGYERVVKSSQKLGRDVTVMQHVPLTGRTLEAKVWGPDCLAKQDPASCSNPIASAYPPSTSAVFREMRADGFGPTVRYIADADRFCDDSRCYSAIGGVSVYFDGSHLSNTYSTSLGPWLATKLRSKTPLDQADIG